MLAAIDELGYTPIISARTLGDVPDRIPGSSGCGPSDRAWQPTHVSRTSFTARSWEASNCAPDRKVTHVIISATDVGESYLTLAKERNLDGIIVIGMYPDAFYQQMKETGSLSS